MIKCRDENVSEKLKKWYGSKGRDINLEELREFYKYHGVSFKETRRMQVYDI